MTTRTHDIYDLTSPFVAPTTPATASTAPTRRSSDRLMRGSTYLLILAGAFLLAAFLVTAFLSRTDVDLTAPFVVAFVVGLAAVVWGTVRG